MSQSSFLLADSTAWMSAVSAAPCSAPHSSADPPFVTCEDAPSLCGTSSRVPNTTNTSCVTSQAQWRQNHSPRTRQVHGESILFRHRPNRETCDWITRASDDISRAPTAPRLLPFQFDSKQYVSVVTKVLGYIIKLTSGDGSSRSFSSATVIVVSAAGVSMNTWVGSDWNIIITIPHTSTS